MLPSLILTFIVCIQALAQEGLGLSPKGCPSSLWGESQEPVCTGNFPKSKHQELLPKKEDSRLLVFVSLSLPEPSLKMLAQDAKRHNAVLVMRGLYQDSFVKTAQRLQELGIAADIHPELFETHHVTSVPTFVKIQGGQPIYSLKGNVTLGFVLNTFESQRVKEAS